MPPGATAHTHRQAIRSWMNRVGTILGIVGILFVASRLVSYAEEIDTAGIGAAVYAKLGVLALVYAASNLLLALAWWHLLAKLCVEASLGWALRAYAVSQLAKYVPGNVFQFAGRQAIGVAAGISNSPLAKSTALEIVFLLVCGSLFAPLILPLLWRQPGVEIVSVVGFIVFGALAIWIASRLGDRRFVLAALCYIAFLALSGVLFAATYEVAGGGGIAASALPSLVSAYVLAWLAGLVTPGAPAGIGVREAVLLFLLGGEASAPVILLAVVMGRAVTVVGDFAFYLAGVASAKYR